MDAILSAALNGCVMMIPLVGAVWMVLRVSVRWINAATRYSVYWIMLATVVAVPMLYLPRGPVAAVPSAQAIRSETKSSLTVIAAAPPVVHEHPVTPAFHGTAQSKRWWPVALSPGKWPARFLIVWALAAALMGLRLVASYVMLQRRKRRAAPASDGLVELVKISLERLGSRRRVAVAVVDDATSPMLVGPFRPTILFPAPLLGAMQDAELEQICLHEAAHVSRYDDWALLAQRLIETLFVPHPLVRLISNRIDLEREIACDDLVISMTGLSRPYAACLTHVAELAGGFSNSTMAATAIVEHSNLTRRVDMLLNRTRHAGTRLLRVRFAALLTSVGLLAFASAKTPALFEFPAAQKPVVSTITPSSGNTLHSPPVVKSQAQQQPVPAADSPLADDTSNGSAGAKYFEQSRLSLKSGAATDAVASAEKGWAAVLGAGPAGRGFIRGVSDAYGVFSSLGNLLRADAVYSEADALCAAPGLQLVRLRLQYMHADRLIWNSEYVKAEDILRASLAIENRTPQKSSLYVAFLQNLAFVLEQQGDSDGAEALYRMTIGYPSPDLAGVTFGFGVMFGFGKRRVPFVGEPRLSMAAFYSINGRFKEAEALYRERLAQSSLRGEERLDVMGRLVELQRAHGSITEALAIEEQIIELRKEQPLTTPELRDRLANERYTLAGLEVDAGRGEDAKALLEADLRQAEALYGRNSPDYSDALNYLFENRSYAHDYESAEKLAREEVRRAEAPHSHERIEHVSALFRLADMLRAKGQIVESDAVRTRGIELNRAAFPQPAYIARFADAEELVRAGKPGEAVRVAREISESAAQTHDDQVNFGYGHLARAMAGSYKTEAAEVASIAVSAEERRLPDGVAVFDLTNWANFYRGQLQQPDRALDLLTQAEAMVRTCCGTASPQMEPVVRERAWLAEAMAGKAASVPYLEQLRSVQTSLYGVQSRQVEQTDRYLAEANRKASR
jgi:beta-lactamase regulating signal transducer with metallopeptidase domain